MEAELKSTHLIDLEFRITEARYEAIIGEDSNQIPKSSYTDVRDSENATKDSIWALSRHTRVF